MNSPSGNTKYPKNALENFTDRCNEIRKLGGPHSIKQNFEKEKMAFLSIEKPTTHSQVFEHREMTLAFEKRQSWYNSIMHFANMVFQICTSTVPPNATEK